VSPPAKHGPPRRRASRGGDGTAHCTLPRASRGRGAARLSALCAIPLLAGHCVAAYAADPAAGRDKAQACAPCHGANGLSARPDAPNLAGQPAIYVAAQLRAFRTGKRQQPEMEVVAKGLSEADIDDLAAWFESIKLEATLPPR
jgi:cytochrome c553